jgi:hypothetical protein
MSKRIAWVALAAVLIVGIAAFAVMRFRPSLHAGIWSCRAANEADAEDRGAIVDAANQVIVAIKSGNPDALLKGAHPLFTSTVSRDSLAPIVKIGARLSKAELPPTPKDIKIVDGDLAVGGTAYCYLHQADGLLYRAAVAGSETRALVTFVGESKPLTFSLHLELWRHEGRWSLVYLHFLPRAHNGRDSSHFVAAADAAAASGDRFAAWILYRAAFLLAAVSPNAVTHDQSAIEQKARPLSSDKQLHDAVQAWAIDGQTYAIRDFQIGQGQGDDETVLSLLILCENKGATDAKKLFEWLKAEHPILAKHFDAVVFIPKEGQGREMRF